MEEISKGIKAFREEAEGLAITATDTITVTEETTGADPPPNPLRTEGGANGLVPLLPS